MFDPRRFENIAGDFPGLSVEIDGRLVTYLDNAASTLKPKAMIDAVNEYYSGISSNVHRGKNYCLDQVSDRYEMARYKVAELLLCSGNEVVFLRNTTEAINLIASGLDLDKSDDVVVFSDSHHSNLLPWINRATVHVVRIDSRGALDIDHYFQLLKMQPRVVAVTHCSNVTGIYQPLDLIASAAKEAGSIVVVDAAQSIPHRKVDVKNSNIDFLAFSAHKMLGPTGLGVLYGKKELLEILSPVNLGGGMVDWVEFTDYKLRKIPHRYEAGTPHIAGAYGLAASIDYLNRVGFDNLEEHDKQLGALMLKMAQKREYIQVVNSDAKADRGAVLSFQVPNNPDLDDVARVLSDSYGIMCRNGSLCAQPYVSSVCGGQVLRVSAYLYNNENDINTFFDALDEVASFMFR